MNKLKLTLFFIYLVINQAFAQFESFTISDSLTENADAVLRKYVETFEIKSPSKAKGKVYKVFTILNSDGAKYATINLPYSKLFKLSDISATVYDSFGKKIKSMKKADILDVVQFDAFFTDSRVKIIDLTQKQLPYTIEFEYELDYNFLLFYPEFTPQNNQRLGVENASFELICPSDLTFRYKTINNSKVQFAKIEKDNKIHYNWNVTMQKPFENEDFASSDFHKEFSLICAPAYLEFEDYKGEIKSWEQFGQFIYTLNSSKNEITPEIQTKVNEIIADCENNLCKIKALYKYLQDNTRYVNVAVKIGGWQPASSSDTHRNKYGDCKGLSNYLVTMLKAANIEAYYTLVSSDNDIKQLDPTFPISCFNHVIVAVPQEKDTIWLECTNQDISFGYLSNFTSDKDVLLITPQGGKLVHTKIYTEKNNSSNSSTFIQLNEDGDAIIKYKASRSGLLQDYWEQVSKMNEKEKKEAIIELLPINNVEILHHKFIHKKNIIPLTSVELDLTAKKLATKTGKRLFIQPFAYQKSIKFPSKTEKRESPICFSNFAYSKVDTINIIIPNGYEIEGKCESREYSSSFGKYNLTFDLIDENTARCVRNFTVNNQSFPSKKIEELSIFVKNINKSDAQKIILSKKIP